MGGGEAQVWSSPPWLEISLAVLPRLRGSGSARFVPAAGRRTAGAALSVCLQAGGEPEATGLARRGGQDQSPQGAGQPLASHGMQLAGEQSPKPHQLYDLGSLHIPTWLMGDGCCCPQQRRGTHGAPRPRGQVRGAIRNGPPSTFWCFPPTHHKILSSQGHPGGTAALLAGGSAAPFTPRAPPCP